ncbi:hypothetical protein DN402_00790 [Streptomyces sp. SW4]|nr:hypothetical protein DN402_00790 [Streptomyces sp. SW4]
MVEGHPHRQRGLPAGALGEQFLPHSGGELQVDTGRGRHVRGVGGGGRGLQQPAHQQFGQVPGPGLGQQPLLEHLEHGQVHGDRGPSRARW